MRGVVPFLQGVEGKHFSRHMFPQPSIRLELGLVEKLIRRWFVRKLLVMSGVLLYIHRFISAERGLQIQQDAVGGAGIDAAVMNRPDSVMRS